MNIHSVVDGPGLSSNTVVEDSIIRRLVRSQLPEPPRFFDFTATSD